LRPLVILTDTGPLVAIVDVNDRNYERCLAYVDSTKDTLLTTAACFTEAMHLLYRPGGYRLQADLWTLREHGILTIHEADQDEYDAMANYMETYADSPMDLADASIVVAADRLSAKSVFTLDSHFYAYRLADGAHIEVVPQA